MNNKKKFPWEDSYPEGVSCSFKPSDHPVHHIFEQSAQRHPEKPCFNFLGKKHNYGEALDMMHRVATGLQKMGIKKGDRVGICLPNTPYFVATYHAALKIGATVVNFNPLYTEEEIKTQILDSGIKIMVTLDVKPIYKKVQACLDGTSLESIVVCSLADALPGVKSFLFKALKFSQIASVPNDEFNFTFDELISHGKEFTEVDIDPKKDIALFQYTGGTTGLPKAAMLTHENVVANTEQIIIWKCGDNPHEKFMAAIPFFHVFAMTAVMNFALASTAELIMVPRFDLKQVLKTIDKEKPTIFPGVPTIFAAINNFDGIEKLDLSSLDFCISGGASLPASVRENFEKMTGANLVEGYGLSEASPVVTCNPRAGGKAGSIGLPLPGTEIEIRNLENLKDVVKLGERGEIFAKGPQVMSGYWHRDKETKETLSKDGWLRTGDVGYMDEDGFIFLTDRLKEIIIINGYNVYPRLIEDAFYKHEFVDEVIVIGVEDEAKGEVPKAFVKLKKRGKGKITEEELLEFASQNLNPIEKPTYVEFRKELPKTLIGKLSKKELYAEESKKKGAK